MTQETENTLVGLVRDVLREQREQRETLGQVHANTGATSKRLDGIDARVCDLEDAKEATAIENVRALETRIKGWHTRIWSVIGPVAVLAVVAIGGLVLRYLGGK